jgi:hypothetical protein
MNTLSNFKCSRVHTNWRQFILIKSNIIEYIESNIDENVVILEISDKQIKVEYVFRDEIVIFDIENIKETNERL